MVLEAESEIIGERTMMASPMAPGCRCRSARGTRLPWAQTLPELVAGAGVHRRLQAQTLAAPPAPLSRLHPALIDLQTAANRILRLTWARIPKQSCMRPEVALG